MESFGIIIAAGFTENCGIIVISVFMGWDSSERAVPQLPSDIYKLQMIVKLMKESDNGPNLQPHSVTPLPSHRFITLSITGYYFLISLYQCVPILRTRTCAAK
jgi:hypothetical protein